MKIKDITSEQVFDSRKKPTIKSTVVLEGGARASFSVPSGASTGTNEALELRDEDGSVNKAINNVEKIIFPLLHNLSAGNQEKIDKLMIEADGTENKSKLGANAILSVSVAVAKAAAISRKMPVYEYLVKTFGFSERITIPLPMMNFLNGGRHAQNSTDFQEFMIIPNGADTFQQAMEFGTKIYQTINDLLNQKNIPYTIGDEGGFAPKLSSNEKAILLLIEAIEKSGYIPGKQVSIALDTASSEIYSQGKYRLESEGISLKNQELATYFKNWINKYPIVSIEDPFDQEDWSSFTDLTSHVGSSIQIVGDDLFTTNSQRLDKGIRLKAANAILVKLNQIGTLSETIDVIKKAQKNNFRTVISHRSGETQDDFIADLAVGTNSGQIKTGALIQPERKIKYDRLITIEKEAEESKMFSL
jgi:enolase